MIGLHSPPPFTLCCFRGFRARALIGGLDQNSVQQATSFDWYRSRFSYDAQSAHSQQAGAIRLEFSLVPFEDFQDTTDEGEARGFCAITTPVLLSVVEGV